MPVGHPRKPTALHKLQGTYRADRHGNAEPEPANASARLPRWAELSGEALRCYKRYAPMLRDMRVLTEPDVGSLVQLCRRYEEYMRYRAQVEAEGDTFWSESKLGRQLRPHPAVMLRDRAWGDFQKGLIEFGLTPVSRSRITVGPKQESDPFADLMAAQ